MTPRDRQFLHRSDGAGKRMGTASMLILLPLTILVTVPVEAVTYTDIAAGLPGASYSSAAWGDYDSDGDLDILLSGWNGSALITRIYRNGGVQIFTDIAAGLPGVDLGSVAWGDYDNDGDLDLLLTGDSISGAISRVYRNGGGFADISVGLPGVYYSSVAWGDYDNDGDPDILLTGYAPGMGAIARVYRNTGGAFADINAGLPGIYVSSVAWGDYDTDGDLDILLAGYTSSTRISRVYRNTGGTFTDIGAALPGVSQGSVDNPSVAWGDYDSDGDLDILIAGDTGAGYISRIYRNNAGTFADVNAGLPGVSGNSVAWGDYDNDGDLDILLAGHTGADRISRIYRNDGNTFANIGAGLTGVNVGSVAWGDNDNDGDLDILLVGDTGSGLISRVYRSDGAPANTAPTAPTSLSANVNGQTAMLSWTGATDAQTPVGGLTYNLRVGTTPGGSEVMSAMANASTGYRRVAAMGNAQERVSWAVTVPAPGPHYWSVQAVDAAFAGSAFAAEGSFSTSGYADLVAGLPGVDESSVAWGDYDSDGDLDIVLTGFAGPNAITSQVYRNDGGIFTGIGASLAAVGWSSVAWGDYDNDGDLDILLAGYAGTALEYIARVYRNTNGTFVDIEAGLPGVYYPSVAWGDYDNDGDLDILLTGFNPALDPISRVYRNTAGGFSDIDAGLPGVFGSSVAWGDCDDDGDLDILLTGISNEGPLSRLYRNTGGMFIDIDAGLPGVYASSVAWGDYDSDGDLDIVLTGYTGSLLISRVYQNDGNAFTDIDAGLPGVFNSSVAWGDCDNDGDLDILLTGETDTGYISRIYQNSGGMFTDFGVGLPGVYKSSVAWGDYDNDGDLDILLTGQTGAAYISRIYESTDAPANTTPTAPTNLSANVNGQTVVLSWTAATDAQTPANALTYNLRVGTTPGGSEVMSAMANASGGYRRVVALGNAQERTAWTLTVPVVGAHYWSVQAVDAAFSGSAFAAESTWEVTGVQDPLVEASRLPRDFTLFANEPNPFGHGTRIAYAVPNAARVTLAVYDVAGRLVRNLFDGEQTAGTHGVIWDGTDAWGERLPAGLYLYRMRAGSFTESRQMVLTR